MTGGAGAGLRWAGGGRPFPGERRSGDAWVARVVDGALHLAVLDVAGHGEAAAELAEGLVRGLGPRLGGPQPELLAWMHGAMRGTPGAAAGLGSFDPGRQELRWTAVGNVWMRRVGGPRLLSRDGLLGARLPRLVAGVAPLVAGSCWVAGTDGLRSSAGEDLACWLNPDELVSRLLEGHARPHDDATCVVVKVLA